MKRVNSLITAILQRVVSKAGLAVVAILAALALVIFGLARGPQPSTIPYTTVVHATSTATWTSTPTRTPTATHTPTATPSPSPTPTPTPTIDLNSCTILGCGYGPADPVPTAAVGPKPYVPQTPPARRVCQTCHGGEPVKSPQFLSLTDASGTTMQQLRDAAWSQRAYQIAPGVVYFVYDRVHHVVVDLQEPGIVLQNIVPQRGERGTLFTPSCCVAPDALVITDADYHGLDGSNKADGREVFFHQGRAALFVRHGQYDIGVVRTQEEYEPVTTSWGGGPIFIWDGAYNFNPFDEWFQPEVLEYYRTSTWAKMTAAVSEDRKYLVLSSSYGLTIAEHAENIIALGRLWGIKIDRALRFDGAESAYLGLRIGPHFVSVLDIPEPKIVNCLVIRRRGE
ncbi:MAG: hypothetical protein OEW09_08605 [Anaerolineae bacterium]|nr:hypothetical protein [Anaerolineae bacterium]